MNSKTHFTYPNSIRPLLSSHPHRGPLSNSLQTIHRHLTTHLPYPTPHQYMNRHIHTHLAHPKERKNSQHTNLHISPSRRLVTTPAARKESSM